VAESRQVAVVPAGPDSTFILLTKEGELTVIAYVLELRL
jgi:hypothetical protein